MKLPLHFSLRQASLPSARRRCLRNRGRFWLTPPQKTELYPKMDAVAYAQAETSIQSFIWELKKNGRSESTIEAITQKLQTLAKRVNILDPEAVKTFLANSSQKNSTKETTASIYNKYLQYNGIHWTKPKYQVETTIPFIPLEKEIDELIAATSKTISTVLQFLKETGARIVEATKTQWIDIDPEHRTASIRPAKGSNPRILPISYKLVEMLNRLPHDNNRVFPSTSKQLRKNFNRQRKDIAKKLSNPRLLQIHFHTLRHWKGTMEYHKTKDIMHVKSILGHKNIECTLIYINIEQALFLEGSDEWTSKAAKDATEAMTLIDAGFQYVQTIGDIHLYRKRK